MKIFGFILSTVFSTTIFAATNQATYSMQERLDNDNLVIPACVFRNANALDVLDFIIQAARPIPIVDDPMATSLRPEIEIMDRTLPAAASLPPLSVNLRIIKVRDALDYVTKTLNLSYKVSGTNILIYTSDGILLNKQ